MPNERLVTEFDEKDRLFSEQTKEKTVGDQQIVQTAEANPMDEFEPGIRQRIESLMIQRMSENGGTVYRCMDDPEFQNEIFLLAKEILTTIR